MANGSFSVEIKSPRNANSIERQYKTEEKGNENKKLNRILMFNFIVSLLMFFFSLSLPNLEKKIKTI